MINQLTSNDMYLIIN